MRELYATHLPGAPETSNEQAWPFLEAWALRHIPPGGEAPQHLTSQSTVGQGGFSIRLEQSSGGSKVLTLQQPDDGDPGVAWRSEISLGPPQEPLSATIRIRLAPLGNFALSPIDYQFG